MVISEARASRVYAQVRQHISLNPNLLHEILLLFHMNFLTPKDSFVFVICTFAVDGSLYV